MKTKLALTFLCCMISLQSALAEEDIPPGLAKAITKFMPGLTPDRIIRSPVAGLYEVVFGPNVVYVSADGRYVLRGDLLDVENKTNLTEEKRRQARLDAVNSLGEESMIVFAPKEFKHTVTVFTDIDCGYCRKLHSEIKSYNDLGIKVRYVAFPRAGIPSDSYDKAVSVWCADDNRSALTMAKAGRPVASRVCENPVRSHYEMGRRVGVNGTPTIVLESGTIVPGYVPASRLMEELEEEKSG
jgi:thiol:disulfide interchange protein DsbC